MELFGLMLAMSNRDNKSRMFLWDFSKNTFLPDSENKLVKNIFLCFAGWIFGHADQHGFRAPGTPPFNDIKQTVFNHYPDFR